jgi:hypothetical protein
MLTIPHVEGIRCHRIVLRRVSSAALIGGFGHATSQMQPSQGLEAAAASGVFSAAAVPEVLMQVGRARVHVGAMPYDAMPYDAVPCRAIHQVGQRHLVWYSSPCSAALPSPHHANVHADANGRHVRVAAAGASAPPADVVGRQGASDAGLHHRAHHYVDRQLPEQVKGQECVNPLMLQQVMLYDLRYGDE